LVGAGSGIARRWVPQMAGTDLEVYCVISSVTW